MIRLTTIVFLLLCITFNYANNSGTVNFEGSPEETVIEEEYVYTEEITFLEEEVTEELPEIETLDDYIQYVYDSLEFTTEVLEYKVFKMGVIGYFNLKLKNRLDVDRNIVSIIDFSKSANVERLWIIDLDEKNIIYNTLVAHGMGSGGEYANSFSNTPQSHQSSLGFYVTGRTYDGKHDFSLKLHGVEPGFNETALERGVVIHAADYVSHDYIEKNGRLGRSHGCPALPPDLAPSMIDLIAEKTCLFLYYPDIWYFENSTLIYEDVTVDYLEELKIVG